MTPFTFQRGETISIALDAVTGDPQAVTTISAVMKALPIGRTTLPDDAPVAASFVITPRAAEGESPAGWTLTIPAGISTSLAPGAYLADARLNLAGGVIVTEPVAIRIKPSVTP